MKKHSVANTVNKLLLGSLVATSLGLTSLAVQAGPAANGKLFADDSINWAGQPADFYQVRPAANAVQPLVDAETVSKLGLNQAQQAQLRLIQVDLNERQQPLQRQLDRRTTHLHSLYANDNPNQADVTLAEAEVADLQQQLQHNSAAAREKALNVLTTSQRAELKQVCALTTQPLPALNAGKSA
ncbi:Spy/CpxP family protein refolding chaperone [Oceanobacter mangrovi]|uniref:Spy/CpxP family protein refolding chaperone n=1 Tax=Oceanobacter mangrovi TaxID=2862510 RepID=UPI001C8DC357|nr:hypothetical protein [Oceanobacter mangrovi]